jgi:hypothetical protein
MGQQVGTTAFGLAGNLIGGFLGGPIGAAIGGMAGGIIGSLVFGHSTKNKPLVPDVQMMNSSYGRSIPIIWGKMRLPAMMLWQTNIATHEHSVGGGGKGLRSHGQTTYSYTQSAALAFCEGRADFLKLFLDGKLFFDWTALFPDEQTKYKFTMRSYVGDETQSADPAMVAWVQSNVLPNNSCPAYHGLAYLVLENPDLTHFGNRFPQASAILQTSSTQETKFTTLTNLVTGYRPVNFWWGSPHQMAIDWVRGQLYVLMVSDTATILEWNNWGIGVYSLPSGGQIRFADSDHIWGGHPGIYPTKPYGLTCVQGGSLYVFTEGSELYADFSSYIMRIDPNTLSFDGHFIQVAVAGGGFNILTELTGFDMVTPLGQTEMLVGQLLYAGICIINPGSRSVSAVLPVGSFNPASIYLQSQFTIGHQDTISGSIDIWYVTGRMFDPDHTIHIWKGTIRGADISPLGDIGEWTELAILHPPDFGITDPQPVAWEPNFGNMFYYDADDSVIIQAMERTIKFIPGVGVVWVIGQGVGNYNPQADTSLGVLPVATFYPLQAAWYGTSQWFNINLADGEVTRSPVNYSSPPPNMTYPFFGGMEFSQSYGDYIVYQGFETQTIYIVYLLRNTDKLIKVGDIITDICGRVAVTPDMIDVTQIDSYTTTGYCVQESKSAGSAIADLLHVYQIDMVESDFKLKFVPRGQAAVVSIPQSDLASVDDKDPSQFWRVKRAQQQELPIEITVRFQDPDLDFQSGASYAKRIELPVTTAWSKRRMSIDLPVILNNTQARQVAEKWLYTMWAERDTVETVLPWKYLFLDPADNITVLLDSGDINVIRIEEQNIGADFSIHVNAAFEDLSVYIPAPHLQGAITGFQSQTVQQAPFGELLQWNTPLLRDEDDTGGISTRIYYAVGAYSAGWITGELWRSTDNSATWQDFVGLPRAASWGYALTELEDTPSQFATDIANTVTVRILTGSTPLSCTYDQMLSGANGALLGSEVIQYQTVSLNADGSLTLSNILRGRRGTEWACATHTMGDLFILLELGNISGYTLSLPEIGVQELWKLVPSGRVIDQAPTDAFTYRGYDLMPYAPVNAKRQLSGGSNLLLSWTRRTRLGGLLVDGSDTAPTYETTEAYEVYLLHSKADVPGFNPGNPASYMRAFTGLTTASVLYTAAMMATDAWDPSQTLHAVIYQLSGVVGRGFPGYHELPPALVGITVGLESGGGDWSALGGSWLWG